MAMSEKKEKETVTMTDPEDVLELHDLKSWFYTEKGIVKAVDGVNLRIPKGKIVGLVGESGCGKSMTARSIMGLLKYPGRIAGGSILFDGKDLAKLREKELRGICGKDISMVFQEPMTSLNPRQSGELSICSGRLAFRSRRKGMTATRISCPAV